MKAYYIRRKTFLHNNIHCFLLKKDTAEEFCKKHKFTSYKSRKRNQSYSKENPTQQCITKMKLILIENIISRKTIISQSFFNIVRMKLIVVFLMR